MIYVEICHKVSLLYVLIQKLFLSPNQDYFITDRNNIYLKCDCLGTLVVLENHFRYINSFSGPYRELIYFGFSSPNIEVQILEFKRKLHQERKRELEKRPR